MRGRRVVRVPLGDERLLEGVGGGVDDEGFAQGVQVLGGGVADAFAHAARMRVLGRVFVVLPVGGGSG